MNKTRVCTDFYLYFTRDFKTVMISGRTDWFRSSNKRVQKDSSN